MHKEQVSPAREARSFIGNNLQSACLPGKMVNAAAGFLLCHGGAIQLQCLRGPGRGARGVARFLSGQALCAGGRERPRR